MLTVANHAAAGEQYGMEDGLANSRDVPDLVAAELQRNIENGAKQCLADRKTTVQDAMEAKIIDLGTSVGVMLVKPRIPSDPRAAWGCLCGTYTCPMWIYSSEGTTTHRIWSAVGDSVEIVDRKDSGVKRLLVSSGSAGHQSAILYDWNGQKYVVLRKKMVIYGQGIEHDERVENELDKFRERAAR
ncbi:MAG: hypothetical protein F8N37_09855 [Telmatospirillum sp.]|nr:hypothetical protein [Telmatospirillum sp.]